MMKYNYKKLFKLIAAFLFLFTTAVNAQNVLFTFANAQNTNDGVDDFLEADIMIQTANGLPDFILGSGQLYLQYDALSFGSLIESSGNFEQSFPDGAGYLLGEHYVNFGSNVYAYGPNGLLDNGLQVVSLAFDQAQSSFAFGATGMDGMVTTTPRKVSHIKVRYADFSQVKEFSFVDRELASDPGTGAVIPACRDQYASAAGSSTTFTLDFVGEPGIQFYEAVFDSSGMDDALSVEDENQLDSFVSVYPNPVKVTATNIHFNLPSTVQQLDIIMYDITGKTVQQYKNVPTQAGVNSISKPAVAKGLYFLKFFINNGEQLLTKKIVIE